MGGEEPLVVMPETSLEQARGAAERLRLKIRNQPFALSGEGLPCEVTVSDGVATGPCRAASAAEAATLMHQAEAALYAAKQIGRSRVTVSPSAV